MLSTYTRWDMGLRRTLMFLAVLFMTLAAFAQKDFSTKSGFYEFTSLTTGHDTSAGWSSEMSSALGYDINSHFAVEAGAPFWLVTTTQSATTSGGTGTTAVNTTHSNSLGDAFLRMKAQAHENALSYSTSLTLTAPTGDTSAGVSTGRATLNWNNRLERDFEHLGMFGEGSFGNSLTSSNRNRRDFTTLGAVSEFRGGLSFDLLKSVSLEASGYGDVGYGNQKVYSQNVKRGGNGLGNASHGRSYEAAYLTTGDSSLVNDSGFSTDLSWSVTPRFTTDVAYNRSVHFSSNSVAVTLGMRLGHIAQKPERN